MGREDLGVVVAFIEYHGRWHPEVPTFSLSRRGTGTKTADRNSRHRMALEVTYDCGL